MLHRRDSKISEHHSDVADSHRVLSISPPPDGDGQQSQLISNGTSSRLVWVLDLLYLLNNGVNLI